MHTRIRSLICTLGLRRMSFNTNLIAVEIMMKILPTELTENIQARQGGGPRGRL